MHRGSPLINMVLVCVCENAHNKNLTGDVHGAFYPESRSEYRDQDSNHQRKA